MSPLKIIVAQEYKNDLKSKSFWISTLVVPVLMIGFGVVVGLLSSESETLTSVSQTLSSTNDAEEWSGSQAMGMMMGMFLTLFVMTYGAMIFNKVKVEKCNRIMEVLATCVTGRTMMLAKIISVGLTGLTQMAIWGAGIIGLIIGISMVTNALSDFASAFLTLFVLKALGWGILFFIGGYVFYGSLFAMVGAMTDRNNENQEYVSVLTFTLLGSFYIGMYAVDHPGTLLTTICSFVPFTASTCATVGAVSGEVPLWESLLSALALLGFAYGAVVLAGKIYTSSLLLKGKKLSPHDILTFFRAS